jgi:AhpD family alkylhydroperoxidase
MRGWAGETEQRLYALSAWRETPFFSDRERAALAWSEALTLISDGPIEDELYNEARVHFSEKELVDLTLAYRCHQWLEQVRHSFPRPSRQLSAAEEGVDRHKCAHFTGKTKEKKMTDAIYPPRSGDTSRKRRELAPEMEAAFQAFSQQVFADGALPAKTKQIIAVAVAHVTQCPYCIRGHTKAALRHGATKQELMEAIWIAAEMRAGGAYAHSALAIDEMEQPATKPS